MMLVRHVPRALAVCLAAATLIHAAPQPFDFTGHWAGSVSSRGTTVPASADFATTGPRTFDGTFTLAATPVVNCTINGTYRRKVKLHAVCDDGTTQHLTAHLKAATQTLTTSYHFVGGHGRRHRATVVLTKAST
jgi:hypothetical protein